MRLVLALAVVATLAAPVRGEEHEAYEEAQPAIEDTPAVAHANLRWHPAWQQLHGVTLEFASMLVGFYGDHTLILKMRNLEPVAWAAKLAGAKRTSLVGVNVSHSGTLGDANLVAYLHDRGVTDEAAQAGRRFVFADGSIAQGTTANAVLGAAFSPGVLASHPIPRRALANFTAPEQRSWTALRAFAGDGIFAAGDDAELHQRLWNHDVQLVTSWEFSQLLPHVTGNSDHYAQRNGRWVAMARRDRAIWSADQWQGQTGTAEAERERGLQFMQDAKAYFTAPQNRALLRARTAMWRSLRRAADRGRWDRVADVLERQHQRDPGFGEALSRDVLTMLGNGHARMRPTLGADELLRGRGVAPVAPWLIQKLRAEPRR